MDRPRRGWCPHGQQSQASTSFPLPADKSRWRMRNRRQRSADFCWTLLVLARHRRSCRRAFFSWVFQDYVAQNGCVNQQRAFGVKVGEQSLKLRSVGGAQIQADVIASHAASMTRMITKGNRPLGGEH